MSAQADESTPAVELVRRSFEIFTHGDIDACVDLLTPDFVANEEWPKSFKFYKLYR